MAWKSDANPGFCPGAVGRGADFRDLPSTRCPPCIISQLAANSLRVAFLAQDAIAQCRFHTSLIYLHQMNATLLGWAQRCCISHPGSDSGNSSVIGSSRSISKDWNMSSGGTRTDRMVMHTYHLSPQQTKRAQIRHGHGSVSQSSALFHAPSMSSSFCSPCPACVDFPYSHSSDMNSVSCHLRIGPQKLHSLFALRFLPNLVFA